jgi:hypothetical protein
LLGLFFFAVVFIWGTPLVLMGYFWVISS